MKAINPATETLVATYPMDSPEEVERKLAASKSAFEAWRRLSFEARGAPLLRAAALLKGRAAALAPLMTTEMGKPISEARAEVTKCAWVCEYYAQNAQAFLAPQPVETDASRSLIRYDPVGAVLAIMPWNFPFWQVFRFAAPALMAGNVCLLKHAENVPGCAEAILGIFREAGFPDGVFDALFIEIPEVEAVIADRRVSAVALTGSDRAGRAVAAQAGRALKTSVLELGGSDPYIILDDADLDEAVRQGVLSRMLNNGQSCVAAKRFIVQSGVAEAVIDKMTAAIAALKVGDPSDESVDVGPLARADLRDDLHAQVQASIAEGARCLIGGTIPDGPGYFYPPTLLVGLDATMTGFREETFGPVATLATVDTLEEAIELANRTEFGLGASIWTDSARGEALAAQIDAGCVFVNGFVKSDPRLPFGGTKRSGYGRELAREGIMEFVNVKTVWIR